MELFPNLKSKLDDGSNRNYISDVERGTRNVSLKAIEKLALGLKVPVYYLFRFSEDYGDVRVG